MNDLLNSFFTWDMLGSLAGAAVATGLVTAFIDAFFNGRGQIPTQVIAYFSAFGILLLSLAFTGTLSLGTGVLCILNALVVSSTASGTIAGARRLMRGKEDGRTVQRSQRMAP